MEGTPIQQLKKYLEPYNKDELISLIMSLTTNDDDECQKILQKVKTDKKWCKLFVHGLSFSTTKETLESHYQKWGNVKEAVVLVDKKGNSKGYGFVTFSSAEEALNAAKMDKKRIDNRVTHCNLAFKGNPKKFATAGTGTGLSPKQRENANDRRLFVHSLAWKTDDESLANVFSEYGELQEAVVIRDKKSGKSKGYGFVTFKYSESAQQALMQPNKKIDGRQTHCNYACERSNMSNNGNNNNNSNNNNSNNNNNDNTINSPNSDNTNNNRNTLGSLNSINSPNSITNNQSNSISMNNSSSLNALNSPIKSMNAFSNPLSSSLSNPLSNQISTSRNRLPGLNSFNSNPMDRSRGLSTLRTSYNNYSNLTMLPPGARTSQPGLRTGLTSRNQSNQVQFSNHNPYGPPSTNPNTNPYTSRNNYGNSNINHDYNLNSHSHHQNPSIISPQSSHDPNHALSMLRQINGQQPNSPIALMGMPGNTNAIPAILNQFRGGGNSNNFQSGGQHPSHLVLGNTASHQQRNPNQSNHPQQQIIVGGVNPNLFSPVPPSTPPYTHINTNKDPYGRINASSSPGYTPVMPQNLNIPMYKHGNSGLLGPIDSNQHQIKKTIIASNQLLSNQVAQLPQLPQLPVGNNTPNKNKFNNIMNNNHTPAQLQQKNNITISNTNKQMKNHQTLTINTNTNNNNTNNDVGGLSPKSQASDDDDNADGTKK